ncbi:uncharacterized protein [Miscanthus floridulus]|uniref:uncharacterized protein n=1 Tax=Miscanthus floridulus TaxID=154761 RepID=UPI00345A2362
MAAYYQEVYRLEDKFDSLELNHILRHLNEAADALAKAASGREPVPTVMELEEDPATELDPLVDWRTLYLNYLLHDTLLIDRMEAQWLAHHAKSFVLVEGELYK